jgi:hypothetical protein
MQTQSPIRVRETEPQRIGSEELAEGLMLVRASTLKVVRLQLAMERRDRRGALEAVDELVELDRRLQEYLGEVPSSDAQLMFAHELEDERAALNREKLTLAAEIISRKPAEGLSATAERLAEEPAASAWEPETYLEFDGSTPRRAHWWLAATLVLLSAIAAAAYAIATPQALALLAATIGAE